jgi:hypothetical protein
MRDDAACHLSAAQAAILLPENMFTPKRMSEAMDAIRKGTMPGESSISVDLITHKAWRKEMSEHLSKLAKTYFQSGCLTPRMRTAIISILYKGKGERGPLRVTPPRLAHGRGHAHH